MTVWPVAAWEPDKAPLLGAPVVSGVVPADSETYGPLAGPSTASTSGSYSVPSGALPGGMPSFIGNAFDAIDEYSAHYILVGDGNNEVFFYGLTSGLGWQQITLSGFVAYLSNFRFAQFKNTVLIVGGQNMMQWICNSSTANVLSGSPAGIYVCVAKDFAIAGNTYDPTNGSVPYRVWWSAFNDPTNWPTPGTPAALQVQSDYNDFDGSQGTVSGLCSNLINCDFLVFFEYGVQQATYVGAPDVFNFYNVSGARGTQWADSIVVTEGMAYYFGENGFYACDGVNVFPIGENKVDHFAMSAASPVIVSGNNVRTVTGGYNTQTRCLFWLFSQAIGPLANGQVLVMFYHKDFQKWTYCYISAFHILAFTGCYDSGGVAKRSDFAHVMATLDSSGNYYHWTGAALPAEVCTVEQQPVPGMLARIGKEVRPLSDGGAPTVAIQYRNRMEDALTVGPDVAMDIAGKCPQRIKARFMRAHIKQPQSAVWQHIGGVDVDGIRPGGRR
jgi:hypothetical protein